MVDGVGVIGGLAAPTAPYQLWESRLFEGRPLLSQPKLQPQRTIATAGRGGGQGVVREWRFVLCTPHEKDFAATNAIDEFPLLSQPTQQPQRTISIVGRGGGQGVVREWQFVLGTPHEKDFAVTNALDEFPLLSQPKQQSQRTISIAGRGGGQGVVRATQCAPPNRE